MHFVSVITDDPFKGEGFTSDPFSSDDPFKSAFEGGGTTTGSKVWEHAVKDKILCCIYTYSQYFS